MAGYLARATSLTSHSENSLGSKPIVQAVDPRANAVQQQQRRVLSDLGNTNNVVANRAPAVRNTIPTHAAFNVSSLTSGSNIESSSNSSNDFGGFDVDSQDVNYPEAVSEYVNDIYNHFKETEIARTAKYGYMTHQTDINEKMRAILVDWLFEVHLKFKLMPETMYLTINLIDRFLERKIVVRQKLQLVGVTAMLLASKYEEIYAPEVRDFVYITDKAYTKEQILMMEATMLNALDFKVTVPTPYVFVNRFLKVAGESDSSARISLLATYLVERCLQEYKMLTYPPSKIAAAGVNIALRTLRGSNAWDTKMERYSGYKQSDLADAVRDIQSYLEAQPNSNLRAVHKKFSQEKFGQVALLPIANL